MLAGKLITKDKRLIFSTGYLFLQKIYHELRIDKICHRIEDKYSFDFDLDSVLAKTTIRIHINDNCHKLRWIAETELYSIDTKVIAAEEIYEGFCAVCTNLDDDPATIIKINHRHWEIEDYFFSRFKKP